MKHQNNTGPKSGVPRSATPKKSKKWPKIINKKLPKTEKIVVYDIVNFQFFQNGHFWTPLKMSFFGPLFWRFCEKLFLRILEFSGAKKKWFKKWHFGNQTHDPLLTRRWPKMSKMTTFWPLFGHFLDTFWPLSSIYPYQDYSNIDRPQTGWSKRWPTFWTTFLETLKMTKMQKMQKTQKTCFSVLTTFCPLFVNYWSIFWTHFSPPLGPIWVYPRQKGCFEGSKMTPFLAIFDHLFDHSLSTFVLFWPLKNETPKKHEKKHGPKKVKPGVQKSSYTAHVQKSVQKWQK